VSTRQDPAAGWYPDPLSDTGLRYWDGTGWTDRVTVLPEADDDRSDDAVGEAGAPPVVTQRVEYDVQTVRVTLVGDKVNDKAVNSLLNKRARQGWSVRSVVKLDVAGGTSPRGVDGLLIVFERPVSAAP
jgi:hypothetical protein